MGSQRSGFRRPAPSRSLGGLLLLLAWVAAVLLGTASPAAAHAQLLSSDPAANAHLDTAPSQVVLRFSEGVTLIDNGFRLLGQDAQERPLGAGSVTEAEVTVPVSPGLADGAYVLVYRVVSADSHPVAGTIPFTVGTVTANPTAAPSLDLGTGVDGAVRLLWGIDRWVAWAGLVLLVGVPAFVAFCWPAGARDPLVRGATVAGSALVVLTALASLPLQAAYATGASLGTALSDGSIPDLLSRTAGKAVVWRVAFAIGLMALWAITARSRKRSDLLTALVAVGALLLTFSWAGHPAVGAYPALTIADDVLHLAAVAVWLGGLLVLAARLLPRPGPDLPEVLGRWSRVAMSAVLVLVVTGSVQAWRELQSVSAFVDTTYGRWVLAKVAGLIVLLFLGNLGRRRVRRWVAQRQQSSGHLRTLRGSVLAELGIAAAVLAATSVLVVTTPGHRQSTAHAQDHGRVAGMPGMPDHGHGPSTVSVDLPNRVRAEIDVAPATVGTPVVTITVRTLDGGTVDPPEVTASAALPASGIEGIPLQLRRTEAGRYLCDTVRFPFPGEWRITVTVRTTDVDSGVGTVSVHLQ